MYLRLIFVFVVLSPLFSKAQIVSNDRSMTDERIGAAYFKEIKPKLENPHSKSYFYDNDWQIGSIYIDEEAIVDNKPLKYDIVRKWIEIKVEEDIMVIPGRKVDKFEWYNNDANYKSVFLPAAKFKMAYEEDALPIGFFELLVNDEVKLLAHKNVKVFQANTSVSISGSHRSHDIVYVTKFYLAKGNEVYEIHKKRRKNFHLFGKHAKKIKKYYKKNGLLTRRKSDLMAMVVYYNELLKSGD